MDEQPRRRRGLWIALLVVGVLVAAIAAVVLFALPSGGQLDRLARQPAAVALAPDVTGVVVVPTAQAEALMDPQLAAAFAEIRDIDYLGLALDTEPDAITVMGGVRARVLGSQRLPVVVRARAVVTTRVDGDVAIRLDRVWIGRLPVPRALVSRVLRETVDGAEASRALEPLGMVYDREAPGLRWDLPYAAPTDGSASASPLPAGVEITSLGVSPTGVRLGVALPADLDDSLRAVALALADDREDLVRRVRGVLGEGHEDQLASFDAALGETARSLAAPELRSGALVSYTEGSVIAHVPGEEQRLLALGDRLPVGSTLETGRHGAAELVLPGGHRLIVRSRTTISLDEATLTGSGAGSPNRVHATATAGKLRAVVAELAREGEFAVDTPNGTLGVRGTDFVVEVERSATQLSVLEGGVAVAGDISQLAAAAVYAAGNAVEVAGGKAGTVSEIGPEEIDRLLADYGIQTPDELLDALVRPNAAAAVMPLVTRYGDIWLRLDADEQTRLGDEMNLYLEANPQVAARIEALAAQLDLSRYE